MLRLLIVDDESEVRELLTIYLGNYPDAELIGAAENVDEAVRLTVSHNPDIVLLDISMPVKDGFKYISEIQELELTQKEEEIKQQNKFRRNLIIGLALLLALALALYYLYRNKRRDHKRLNKAHEDLKQTQDKLVKAEKRIKTRY